MKRVKQRERDSDREKTGKKSDSKVQNDRKKREGKNLRKKEI